MNSSVEVKFDQAKIVAEDLIRYGVMTVKRDTPIYQAIAMLVDKKITGLPVVDDEMKVLGLISEKDLLNVAYHIMNDDGDGDGDLKNKKVADIMTTDVVSFKTTSNVADICQCFMNSSFRRVPILEDDKLVGLISRKDIIYKTFEKI